jgi:hypothetical protein
MATPKTVRTYPLNGSQKDFPIPFEYLARKFVVVTLIGVNRKELVLNTDYRFTTPTQITTTIAWGTGQGYDLIEIRRLTSATDRLVDFADGSILRAYDLNTSQIQSLHIAEEARDLTADTIAVNNDGNLDARAKRIVNVADAVDDGDAVNLRMQKVWAGSALNQANVATQQAGLAAQARTGSEAARNTAQEYRDSALAYRDSAYAYRQDAGASRDAAANSATSSENSNVRSQEWASKAEDVVVTGGLYSSYHYSRKSFASAGAAAASAATAAQKVIDATTQVQLATNQADRAKTEADKLGNFNELAAALKGVTAQGVQFNRAVQADTYVLSLNGQLLSRALSASDVSTVQFQNSAGSRTGIISSSADGSMTFSRNSLADQLRITAGGTTITGNGYCTAQFEATNLKSNSTLAVGNGGLVGTDGNLYGSVWGNNWLSNVVLTTSNFRANMANIRVNDLGSYCQAIYLPNGSLGANSGTAGGNLYLSSTQGSHGSQSPAGSWYVCGWIGGQLQNTIWQRYA